MSTKEAYLDEIIKLIEDADSNETNVLEVLDMLRVCPLGFMDYDIAELIQLESDVSSYHQLPSGGGIFDETEVLVDGFRAIRRARDDYYLLQSRRKAKK